MAISIQIDPDTGVAIATCSGALALDDALESAASMWELTDWPRRAAAVWDFRDAEFDISSADARKMARFVLEGQPSPPPSRIAFVTEREVDFGMARVFGVFREDSRTAFRVFRDFDEALRWAEVGDAEPG